MRTAIPPWRARTIRSATARRPERLRRSSRVPIDTDQQVTVLGLGYIGLPTAALIARSGCRVTGVDVSPQVVDTINSGKVRSEEHTSELQSLMRISYAVFCLKKKKKQNYKKAY